MHKYDFSSSSIKEEEKKMEYKVICYTIYIDVETTLT